MLRGVRNRDASTTVGTVATHLDFAAIEVGRLDKSGVPLHVLGGLTWRASVSESGEARLIEIVT